MEPDEIYNTAQARYGKLAEHSHVRKHDVAERCVAEAFGYEACVRAKRYSGKRRSRSELRDPFSPCQPT